MVERSSSFHKPLPHLLSLQSVRTPHLDSSFRHWDFSPAMIRISPPVFVFLLIMAVAVAMAYSRHNLLRKRREWIVPPRNLKENVDYTKEKSIAKIRSDYEADDKIIYSLEGVGANKAPYHVFVVEPTTGLIRVTKKLDREEIAMYNLSGVAQYQDGTHAEKKIDIRIRVVDENDNSPVFGKVMSGKVNELSPSDTSVMKITATDADEPGNENSQIAYTIIDQNPHHDMFYINSDGTLYVKKSTLDRETVDQYILTVKGQDLNGRPGGNAGTGTVTINVMDVNDNLPTLEKEEYEGSIEENTHGVEVMRLKTKDMDLKGTENWEAVFDIVKGNEAGYFSISTDPITNEGILMLDKAVDYEDVKDLDLGIAVRNKAPPYGPGAYGGAGIGFGGGAGGGGSGGTSGTTGGSGGAGGGGSGGTSGTTGGSGGSSWQSGTFKTYPVKINVKNQPEGPSFDPKVKAIPISEESQSININQVIAHYPAIDGDTRKPAENVRYAKGSDPDNWLTIDPKTAEIKLNKIPDRESEFLVNGTYFAKVLCITEDMPAKTATGTIAIQVEDYNDHCPTLTSDIQTMCATDDSVFVNAKDEDFFPNGPPFDFVIVPEGTQGKWKVEHLNDTAAILRAQEKMWPGEYEVTFVVTDEQGLACPEPQKVRIQVCTCEDGVLCGAKGARGRISKGSELGSAGIALLLLGLLLLLLIPLLLLFCQCGGIAGLPLGFTDMPFDTKSHLMNYHTEGQGENTQVPLINTVTKADCDVTMGATGVTSTVAVDGQKTFTAMDGMNVGLYQDGFSHREGAWGVNNQTSGSGFYSEFQGREAGGGGGIFDGMALPDHFLKQYYADRLASGNEDPAVKDNLLVYDFEGQGSSAGSVGCCSLLESNNDLAFLDNLGPKFKTLAEVCGGKRIPAEVKKVLPSLPSAPINTQSSAVSVETVQQLSTPPQLQPLSPKRVQTVVRETSERSHTSKENTTAPRGGMTRVVDRHANQGQVFLVQQQQQQQPVYLTTAPVPMHYVFQPQVQNTMLLAEAPASNLQGMVLVNGTQTSPAQHMIVQGQTVMSTDQAQGPGMMLMGMSGVQGGGANLINTGSLSGSQTMMVVEGRVPAGSMRVVKGGTLPAGGSSGSQTVLVVGGPKGSGGQLAHEGGYLSLRSDIPGSQKVLYTKGSTSPGTHSNVVLSSTTKGSKTLTSSKMVVQETRESH